MIRAEIDYVLELVRAEAVVDEQSWTAIRYVSCLRFKRMFDPVETNTLVGIAF